MKREFRDSSQSLRPGKVYSGLEGEVLGTLGGYVGRRVGKSRGIGGQEVLAAWKGRKSGSWSVQLLAGLPILPRKGHLQKAKEKYGSKTEPQQTGCFLFSGFFLQNPGGFEKRLALRIGGGWPQREVRSVRS